ncbi:MAG: glycosyltransferase family 4 protein [Euryarchaeota archaeon]
MKKILFIRSNPVFPDPRVQKEAKSLSDYGHDVKILAWDRTGKLNKNENINGYLIKRFNLKASYGKPSLIMKLFIWLCYEFIYLMKSDYDIIHSCDFDTLVPAFIVARIRNKKLVYDCFDFYADSLPIIVPYLIRSIISWLEIYFAKKSDFVILPDPSRVKQFKNKLKNPLIIYNTPNEPKHRINKINNELFEIFFAGAIYKGRGIENIVSATKDIDDIKITIAGYYVHDSKIIESIEKEKNVEFIGKINYDAVLKRTLNCDIIFALYDPKIPNHKYASPNKLFEAMMCGKPIIVSAETSMAKIVKNENCGIIVNYNDIKEIKNVIICLKKNPILMDKLGKNGRNAYEKEYNWQIMENRLLTLYKEL